MSLNILIIMWKHFSFLLKYVQFAQKSTVMTSIFVIILNINGLIRDLQTVWLIF